MSDALNTPMRSPMQALADLQEKFDSLPLTDPRRGPLSIQIRQLEDWIDAHDVGEAT